MKRKFLAFAIALIGMTGIAASAQTSSDNCNSCPAGSAAPGDNNKMRQPRDFSEFAFEGVLLSVDQQARMDSLNAAYKAKANCNQRNGQCNDAAQCANRTECADSAQCRNGKGGHGDARDGRRDKVRNAHARGMRGGFYDQEYVEKVKEILTPDQYTTFLENIVFMPQNMKAANAHSNPVLRGRMSDKVKRDIKNADRSMKSDFRKAGADGKKAFRKVENATKDGVSEVKAEMNKIDSKDKASK